MVHSYMNEQSESPYNPAHHLEGINLPDGWTVTEKLQLEECQTGSNFSVGYIAKHPEHGIAFLKALNLYHVLEQEDQARAVKDAFDNFEFEASVVKFCNEKGLTKIVRVLGKGEIQVTRDPRIGRVNYILFEHSDGDIRKVIHSLSEIDEETALSILHEVAIGLTQIHRCQVAHQDIKPSNILQFEERHPFKITDFGTSSKKGSYGPRDHLQFAGDRNVSPPELMYGSPPSDWRERRVSADMYALGSLAVFLYTGHHLNYLLFSRVPPEYLPANWQSKYPEIMPIIQRAFSSVAAEIQFQFHSDVGSQLLDLVYQLTDPNPNTRGWQKKLSHTHRRLNCEPFVSKLGSMRRKAEFASRRRIRETR